MRGRAVEKAFKEWTEEFLALTHTPKMFRVGNPRDTLAGLLEGRAFSAAVATENLEVGEDTVRFEGDGGTRFIVRRLAMPDTGKRFWSWEVSRPFSTMLYDEDRYPTPHRETVFAFGYTLGDLEDGLLTICDELYAYVGVLGNV